MEIKTSNVIAQRLDDMSTFGEYDQKVWVAVDDILNLKDNEWNLQLLKNQLKKQKLKKCVKQKIS